jgi:hypothetical protein
MSSFDMREILRPLRDFECRVGKMENIKKTLNDDECPAHDINDHEKYKVASHEEYEKVSHYLETCGQDGITVFQRCQPVQSSITDLSIPPTTNGTPDPRIIRMLDFQSNSSISLRNGRFQTSRCTLP